MARWGLPEDLVGPAPFLASESAAFVTYEPPGETHTLFVAPDVEEMITLFPVNGLMLYVDTVGNAPGYEDVFLEIATCRKYYVGCSREADFVDPFIR